MMLPVYTPAPSRLRDLADRLDDAVEKSTRLPVCLVFVAAGAMWAQALALALSKL